MYKNVEYGLATHSSRAACGSFTIMHAAHCCHGSASCSTRYFHKRHVSPAHVHFVSMPAPTLLCGCCTAEAYKWLMNASLKERHRGCNGTVHYTYCTMFCDVSCFVFPLYSCRICEFIQCLCFVLFTSVSLHSLKELLLLL